MSLTALPQPEPKRAAALFKEFQCMYGAKVAKAWDGVALQDVLVYWERELANWKDSEIRKALTHCREYVEFPPTLPEFVRMLREQNRVVL